MAHAVAIAEIADEDRLRAQWYGLLGSVFRAAPDAARLKLLAELQGDDTEFGQAVTALAAVAATADATTVQEEYFDLFVGVGRGELLPYGSYYLAGFLYEKPLAELRAEMRELGIAPAEGVKEPEDHIAAIMEMMSGLITGAFGEAAEFTTQRRFFRTHLGSWAPRFFEDLENASAADFYKSVGRIGSLFMAIEIQAFEMAA